MRGFSVAHGAQYQHRRGRHCSGQPMASSSPAPDGSYSDSVTLSSSSISGSSPCRANDPGMRDMAMQQQCRHGSHSGGESERLWICADGNNRFAGGSVGEGVKDSDGDCAGPACRLLGDKSPPRTARHSISVCIAISYVLERSLWLHELIIHAVLRCYNYTCTNLVECPFAGPDRRTRTRYM